MEEENLPKQEKERAGDSDNVDRAAGLLFIGCILIGGALGNLFLEAEQWIGWLLGVGFGFLAMGILHAVKG
ncbi:MAG: hypothetical protein GWO20_08800 [Candidatus Korarchaeota archaeon]|nr:hypothetical protein [Candidatus Korarchaeota archaeon]NIU83521.1 hypothetical protein [Candidatus Thorarchaeota archaeon]NIW13786.1 hypothetical protein [Candidatus Thorarchaeota archaeon]NIW51914.1 hypothetical protein [Candidatus Korarchaeota archaeon]